MGSGSGEEGVGLGSGQHVGGGVGPGSGDGRSSGDMWHCHSTATFKITTKYGILINILNMMHTR